MRLGRATAIALPLVAAGSSCLLGGFENASVTGGSSTSSASAASSSGATDAGSDATTCTHALPPDPPTTHGGSANISFIVAAHSIDLGDKKVVGYDLDNHCTCEGDGRTCTPRGSSMMSCDLTDGVDNATAKLVRQIQTAYPTFSSAFFTAKADAGDWSMVFRITGYDDQPDDDLIEVDMYPVSGRPVGVSMPKWDGTDAWPVPVSSLVDGKTITQAKYKDDHAYVRGGVLYASLPSTTLRLSGGLQTMRLDFTGAILTAKIGKDSKGAYHLTDGIIAGRWRLPDLFKDIGSYRNEKGTPLCTTDFVWTTAKSVICDAPDILSTLGGATLPCDALSFGFGFTADPALLFDTPKPDTMDTTPCPPGTDPKDEMCK